MLINHDAMYTINICYSKELLSMISAFMVLTTQQHIYCDRTANEI